MPEGPEIRRAADQLNAALQGRRAHRIFFAFEHLERFQEELAGLEIRGVEARGKAVLTRFGGGWNVYSHNQLYGRWFVRQRGEPPRTRRTLRFAVHTGGPAAFLYSASEIEVLRDGELANHPYLARLGPDPLDPALLPSHVSRRAADDRFRRRGFAGLLLDQGFLAGIGNYLRSDILFFAHLHPRRRPADCSPRELAALGRAALEVTRRSYETGGITNRRAEARKLKRRGEKRRQYRHMVFARAGQPCRDCATPIVKENLAGRRLYHCPTCQPPPNEG